MGSTTLVEFAFLIGFLRPMLLSVLIIILTVA